MTDMNLCTQCEEPVVGLGTVCSDCRDDQIAGQVTGQSEAEKARAALEGMRIDAKQPQVTPEERTRIREEAGVDFSNALTAAIALLEIVANDPNDADTETILRIAKSKTNAALTLFVRARHGG